MEENTMNKKFLIILLAIIIMTVVLYTLISLNIDKSKEIADNNENNIEQYIPNWQEVERSPEDVSIEILNNTIKRDSLEILITDNNKFKYGWTQTFRIQKKIDGNWQELEKISDDLFFYSYANSFDENNQLRIKLDCKKYYGVLENGTYRIVKPVYNIGYFLEELYSNEFEIINK